QPHAFVEAFIVIRTTRPHGSGARLSASGDIKCDTERLRTPMHFGTMRAVINKWELRMLKNIALAGLVVFSTSAAAQYATQSGTGEVWKNSYGLCWHSAFWTSDQAIEGCDAVARPAPAPRAAAPVQQVVEPKVEPAPAPAPVAQEPAP